MFFFGGQILVFLLVGMVVETLAGCFGHAENDKEQANKVDGCKNAEAIVAEVVVHLWPDGVDDKVEEPVGCVAES